MVRRIFLDAGPVGVACSPPGKPRRDDLMQRLADWQRGGALVYLPEVADYEVRRELIRSAKGSSLQRLDLLRNLAIFLPIHSDAMLRAAEAWADVRNRGLPTAGPDSLDGDAVLAGQVITATRAGDTVEVASDNATHLTRFGLDARRWENILL